MALHRFGFIVTGTGYDPAQHVTRLASPQMTTTVVGGFGPIWTARVIEAIGAAVLVGVVGYGPESSDTMHALFAT